MKWDDIEKILLLIDRIEDDEKSLTKSEIEEALLILLEDAKDRYYERI